MKNINNCLLMLVTFFLSNFALGEEGKTPKRQVLVVMSYSDKFEWTQEEMRGIEQILKGGADIHYRFLHTKTDKQGGPSRAKKIMEEFKDKRWDGVIACDDDAQKMFVIPYFKNKSKTPVMFCGVNASAKDYGYPTENISGILEVEPFTAAIYLAKQLLPEAQSFYSLMGQDTTGSEYYKQVKALPLLEKLPVLLTAVEQISTVEELLSRAKELEKKSDFFLYATLEGLKDKAGKSYSDKEIISKLIENLKKPLIATSGFRVNYGALAAVAQSGEEQGMAAAEMLLKAMSGTSVQAIPLEESKSGRRIINKKMLKRYKINLPASVLRNADLRE